jgi:sarcosine oxidase / L-pipecolate oxidase
MPDPQDPSAPIIIIGGGTWGLSTALHLARRGYTEITVLDAHPIPSPISAGNDVNKIVEQGMISHKSPLDFEYPR